MAYAHCSLTGLWKCALTLAVQSSNIRCRGVHPQQDFTQLVKIINFYSTLAVTSSDSMVQGKFEGVLLHKTGVTWFIQCQKNPNQMEIAVTCFRTEKLIDSNGVITNLHYTLNWWDTVWSTLWLSSPQLLGFSLSWHSPSLQAWNWQCYSWELLLRWSAVAVKTQPSLWRRLLLPRF